jgi:hypothetical protein
MLYAAHPLHNTTKPGGIGLVATYENRCNLVAAEKYGKFTAGVRAAAEKYIWQIHRRTHMRRPALRKKSLING